MQAKSPLSIAEKIPLNIKRKFHDSLKGWFKDNGRKFPWRETNNPYHVLISEVMLQKTNSRVVGDIYISFIQKFPSPSHVVKSTDKTIHKIIYPLGLFYRTERILNICKSIVEDHNGEIPKDLNELMKLNGIGRYAASAVLSFGFGEPVAILDQNVIRIFSRVFDIKSIKTRPHLDKELWQAAYLLLPQTDVRKYNFALLDLSAIICKPKPNCKRCPINQICFLYKKTKGI